LLQSDEEPVDVMPAIRKACEPKCEQSFGAYQACLDRVKAKGVGACDGQYFDFLHCIDQCVRSGGGRILRLYCRVNC
jgi:ubiquinol-cytochrome c reductase subunit 6